MDRGAWQVTKSGVAKTWLSDWCTHTHTHRHTHTHTDTHTHTHTPLSVQCCISSAVFFDPPMMIISFILTLHSNLGLLWVSWNEIVYISNPCPQPHCFLYLISYSSLSLPSNSSDFLLAPWTCQEFLRFKFYFLFPLPGWFFFLSNILF